MQTTHSMRVLLPGGDKVNDFVRITSVKSYPIFLCGGRYRINAKSLIGIFSLDLSRSLIVQADCSDQEAEALFEELQKFAAGTRRRAAKEIRQTVPLFWEVRCSRFNHDKCDRTMWSCHFLF